MEKEHQNNIQLLIIKSFDEDLHPNEKDLLDNWLAESPENATEYSDLQEIWDQSYDVNATPKIDIDMEWDKFKTNTFPKEEKGKLIFLFSTKVARYAAILLIGLFIGTLYMLSPRVYETEHNRRTVELSDGSIIKLNQNSKLKVSKFFNWSNRDLKFEGEAFFEVAHNPEKPFTIHSQSSHIQVLGTSFNYNTTVENPQVQVNSGKVAFWADDRDKALELTKGMQGQIIDGELRASKIDDDNYKSWENGIFHFDGIALKHALRDLQAYYEINFEIENESLNECRLTASFEKYKLEEVLEELEILMKFDIEKQYPNYILKGGTCP